MHGATHVKGGPDPIPGLGTSGVNIDSYRDLILAEPDLWGMWPMDDTAGTASLHNLVSGGDPLAAHDSVGYFGFEYEQPGPFTSGPEKSILFQGARSTSLGTGCWGTVVLTDPAPAAFAEFTVEMWAYPTVATWGQPASFRVGSSHPFAIQTSRVVATDMELTAQIGGTGTGATGYILDLNAWYHIAATYDGTTLRLYANGVEVGTAAAAGIDVSGTDAFFGAVAQVSSGTNSVYFNGRLSLAAVYTAALDATTIAEHAGGGSGETVAPPGQVWTGDGSGGTTWAYPTIAVDDPAGRYDTLNLGTNLTGIDMLDGSITIDAAGGGGASLSDTAAWMPLVDSDGTCVLDADGDLIPTLISL
jgi:hypothetical protein